MKSINPDDLVNLQQTASAKDVDLRCDLIYADAAHPLNATFRTALYKPDAKLWLHKTLADIVLEAAHAANTIGLRLVATDGLRTTDAQKRMQDTAIVRANPHWTIEGPKMLISKPGAGGHPRGMAVDVYLERMADGQVLDMGTVLDHFTTDPDDNPAARDYKAIPQQAKSNRALLEKMMGDAARKNGTPLLPLPSEWWDFRLPPEIFNVYAPLSDSDLPPEKRMCS